MKRYESNPIITCNDVKPTFPFLKVEGVFNAGAIKYNNKYLLLLRIAESAIGKEENLLSVPVVKDGELKLVEFNKTDGLYDYSDSRAIKNKVSGKTEYLTSISHVRLATSDDGINFEISDEPLLWPSDKYEQWGIEDPRVVCIEGNYYINYTAVSKYGAATKMQKTKDFKTFEDMGIIFVAENKDVCLFNRKINGLYYAYHRPVPNAFGEPDIYCASSPDLINWGNHKHFLGVTSPDKWDGGRIGGGAPSFETEKGWVHIYHASSTDNKYCLGAFITSKDDPTKIIAKTDKPILEPKEEYEINGFFGNVVFTCGVIFENDELKIYYGASDDKVCLATITLNELYKKMGV